MKTGSFILLLGLLLALAGCSGDPKLRSKVVGTWKIDMSTAGRDAPPQVKMSPYYKDTMRAVAATRFTFNADGSMSIAGLQSKSKGQWHLSGDEIVLTPDTPSPSLEQMKLTIFPDGSKIRMGSRSGEGDASELVRADASPAADGQ